jgi:ATP-dependent exoDNAse (exonuclease V) beta subunit
MDMMKEEERRLFYVAITRARKELNLITEAGNESSFLREIPEALMKRITIIHEAETDSLVCPECNNLLLQKLAFCGYCGARLG